MTLNRCGLCHSRAPGGHCAARVCLGLDVGVVQITALLKDNTSEAEGNKLRALYTRFLAKYLALGGSNAVAAVRLACLSASAEGLTPRWPFGGSSSCVF